MSLKTARSHTNGVHPPTEAVEDSVQQPSKQEPQRPITPHNEYLVAREESHEHEEPTRDELAPSYPHITLFPPVSTFEPSAQNVVEQRIRTPEQDRVAPVPVPPSQSSRQSSKQAPLYDQLRQEDIESHPAFQELLARYSDALLELELLRKEYAGAGRGRSDVDTVAGESDVVDDSVYHQDGVPLQVVVIIALAVFITTYLFL